MHDRHVTPDTVVTPAKNGLGVDQNSTATMSLLQDVTGTPGPSFSSRYVGSLSGTNTKITCVLYQGVDLT